MKKLLFILLLTIPFIGFGQLNLLDKKNGFKNPSVYCEDYLMLFDHITSRLKEELN